MKLALVNPALAAGASERNLAELRALLDPLRPQLESSDLVLLPEHWHFGGWDDYLADTQGLARWLGCHLVAGSFHKHEEAGPVNTGAAATGPTDQPEKSCTATTSSDPTGSSGTGSSPASISEHSSYKGAGSA